ncbi:MAG: hypothetical protein NDF55_03515 [archaeon GB-1867-005]|nr:hypothetical protein [Candidatus Culexmicrobium cathedralense]
MSATFTFRLPKELLKRMKERRDINWAQIFREVIRRVLNEPVLPKAIEDLIHSLYKSDDWEALLCLYLKADLLNERYILRNLETIYPGRATEIVDRLNSLLSDMGVDPRLSGYSDGLFLRDIVKDGLLMYGVYDKFEEDIKEKLEDECLEVKKAVWLLSQYFVSDPFSEHGFTRYIVPNGFARTLRIMLDRNDVSDLIERLIRMGLVFIDLYSSRAYYHEMIVGADYAYPIFKNSFLKGDYFVSSYLTGSERSDFMAFLKWLSKGYGLEFRAVVEYEDDKVKREFDGKRSFNEVLTELIKKGIVLIDYWPYRRRAGKRSSMPPRWVYKLTPAAKRKLLPQLFSDFSNLRGHLN